MPANKLLSYPLIERRGVDRFDKFTLLQHRRRAEKFGLPATLTMEEWQSTTEYFEGRCAYCQEKPWQVLEHFIPIALGGGTTVDNCVPACRSCNNAKRELHPLRLHELHPLHLPFDLCNLSPGLSRVGQSIQRVQQYLESHRVEVQA